MWREERVLKGVKKYVLLRYRGRGGNRGKLVSVFEGGESVVYIGHYPLLGNGCNGSKNDNHLCSGPGSGKHKGRRRG